MPASPVLLEVIATTLSDARTAAQAGADRLELVTGLAEGGLTPSIGLIEAVMAAVSIPVHVVVRPHSRGFVYLPEELALLERDTRAAVASGAAGIVFGALTAQGEIDTAALARIAEAASGRPITFHRAFDVSRDLNAAFETLMKTPAVKSVLTSGGRPSVLDGRDTLARLVRRSGEGAC
ncbi:MAG: Copper homeostasis protein CutC [Burkholderia plantarii]|nr:MAG: Copper homeostasis protein CutC [Burkholderia plantarii]